MIICVQERSPNEKTNPAIHARARTIVRTTIQLSTTETTEERQIEEVLQKAVRQLRARNRHTISATI